MRKEHKNKVSIVFTARNDNYGGDLIDRINALMKVLIFLTNKHKSDFELIVVEYNPPDDQKRLHEVLSIKNNKHLTVRFIEFPGSYHRKFENSERIKLFEYIGKNIGVRRATGDFIVSTNQDIIFSDDFIKHLTFGKLQHNKFYRTNRIDVHLNSQIFGKSAQAILEYCRLNYYLIKETSGDRFTKLFSMQSLVSLFKNTAYAIGMRIRALIIGNETKTQIMKHSLHTYAAGDFLMMHKKAWKKVQGYLEIKKGNDYLDSLILFNAVASGIKQEIIAHDMYHIDHLMSKFGRPSISPENFVKMSNDILSAGRPNISNGINWGENSYKLKEKILKHISS